VSRRPTTLQDVARLAGVSVSTASRALNDSPSINRQTKQRIWKLAREQNYPFRDYMPAGPIGAEATIAVVVPRPQGRDFMLRDPFFLDLLSGIAEAARERDCDLLVSHVAPASYEDLSVVMSTSRADGVIFLGQSMLHSAFNRLAEEESQFVVWGAQLPDQNYCSVGSDNIAGAARATGHLVRLGRRRIMFLGDTTDPEPAQRYAGYLEALEKAGLMPDPRLSVPAHFEVESADAAVDALLRDGVSFDGVVAASDVIALGAIRALRRAGVSTPGDVSVVGFDNVRFARYATPTLSTVAQDTSLAGRLLVSKLLDAGSGRIRSRSERLPTDLIVRESCGG
jgi:DNA-binding LacI/PurR family transcriptional regulator